MKRMTRWLAAGLLLGVGLPGCGEPGPPPMRNAVLIVIDTLRSDALEHAETPAIDALAARGTLAPLSWSSETWTGGSIVSLFSGRHARDHGWIQGFPGPRASDWAPMPTLPDVPMLAEVLGEAGFHTAGYYANHVLSWELGFERGFDRWEFVEDADLPEEAAVELRGWDDGERHFLYLHFLGPHSPLDPSRSARRRWKLDAPRYSTRLTERVSDPARRARAIEQLRRAYWAVVEDTDARIGLLLRFLEPYMDETVIVLTSDHGEQLGERNRFGHGGYAYESLTRVPFIAVNTGELPGRFNNAIAADLLTRALGVDHDWHLQVELPELLIAEHVDGLALSPDGRVKAHWAVNGGLEVFDLSGYPEESPGLGEQAERLREARARFERETERGEPGPARVSADPELLEALRALGYVGD
ncbi:MAG: sulfatase-like hydrolase/transferase [Myxococcota bacterium]